jgi:hypothetical protein
LEQRIDVALQPDTRHHAMLVVCSCHPPICLANFSVVTVVDRQHFVRVVARQLIDGAMIARLMIIIILVVLPLAAAAVAALPAHSFLIDGEAIVTNAKGLAVFDLIRHKRHGAEAVLIAFDLFELAGEDLRRLPIESRKRGLAKLARGPHPGIVLNEFFEGVGDIIFEHACRLGCEGIVSKLNDYRADRHQLDFDGATQSRS